MDFLFSSIKRVFFYSEQKIFLYVICIFTFFFQILLNNCNLLLANENIAKNHNNVANSGNIKNTRKQVKNIKYTTNEKKANVMIHQVIKNRGNSNDFTQEFNKKLLYQSNDALNKIIDKIEYDQKNGINKNENELLNFWDFQVADNDKNGFSNTYAGMIGDKRLGKGMNLDITLEQRGDGAWLLVIDGKKVEDSRLVNSFLQENPSRFIVDVNTAFLDDKVVNFTYQMPKEIRLRYGHQSFGYRVALDLPNGTKIASKKIAKNQISVKLINIDLADNVRPKKAYSENISNDGITNTNKKVQYDALNYVSSDKLRKIYLGKKRPFVITVDAGHGGIDPGAKSKSGVSEKDITLKYAKQLSEELRKKGFKVFLTRDKDKTMPLAKRVHVATNVNTDLFISLHTDANEKTQVSGTTVYRLIHLDKSSNDWNRFYNNSYLPERYAKYIGDKSILDILISMTHLSLTEKASIITDNILLAFKKDGICKKCRHGQRSLAVLRGLDLTSILIEIGYITNADEEKKLLDKTHMKKFAKSLAEVIANTFEE